MTLRTPATATGRPRRKALDAELPTLIRPWTDFRAEQWRLTLDAIEAEATDPYRTALAALVAAWDGYWNGDSDDDLEGPGEAMQDALAAARRLIEEGL